MIIVGKQKHWGTTMQIYKDLSMGQRFKKIRLEKGISQEKLAEGICSNSVVSHIETDRQYPSAHIWGKLAERLGVPVYEIMGEKENQMETSFQLDMIRVYIEKGEYAHAFTLIDELQGRQQLLEHQRVDLLLQRAECSINSGRMKEAIEILLPFVERQDIQQTVDDLTLCDSYNKLGKGYFKLRDFEKAYAAFERGYRITLKFSDLGTVAANVTYNLGLTCSHLGYKEDGRRFLEKAHQFYKSVSDIKNIADTLFAIAISSGDVSQLNTVRSLYESMNLIRESIVVRQHYAFHVESKINYENAINEFRDTAMRFESLGDIGMSVYTLSRAVAVCLDHDDLELASELCEESIERRERINEDSTFALGYFYKVKAALNLRLNRFEECISDAKRASDICAIMGMYAESAEALQLSARAFEFQGEYQKAYEVSCKIVDLLLHAQRRKE
jgi:tetratricopeptide (TPR) repeat protein